MRKYSDKEILDPDFPDPRMPEKQHRPLRHEYYRNKVRKKREQKYFSLIEKLIERTDNERRKQTR